MGTNFPTQYLGINPLQQLGDVSREGIDPTHLCLLTQGSWSYAFCLIDFPSQRVKYMLRVIFGRLAREPQWFTTSISRGYKSAQCA